MKDLPPPSSIHSNKRTGENGDEGGCPSSLLPSSLAFHRPNKKPRRPTIKSALINLQPFDLPLISSPTGSPLSSIRLHPDRPYTFGRTRDRLCDFVFCHPRVSKRHCQVLFDGLERKIYVLDGSFLFDCSTNSSCVVSEFRRRIVNCDDQLGDGEERVRERVKTGHGVRASLNGVFVNGGKVEKGMVRELCVGDEVLLACGNEEICGSRIKIGFLIQGVVFKEEVVSGSNEVELERPRLLEAMAPAGFRHSQSSVSSGKRSKRVFAIRVDESIPVGSEYSRLKCGGVVGRAKFLSSECRDIVHSDDPISYIRQCALSDNRIKNICSSHNKLEHSPGKSLGDSDKYLVEGGIEVVSGVLFSGEKFKPSENSHINQHVRKGKKGEAVGVYSGGEHLCQKEVPFGSDVANNSCKNSSLGAMDNENDLHLGGSIKMKTWRNNCPSPGKRFYLNRLQFMDHNSNKNHNIISLPELLYPVGSILRIFIATFTSDILWYFGRFLTHCQIPCHLPVTIACHNTERCWSCSPDKRTHAPYSDFPNMVVVFPPFPEAIAFGKDRKRQGIACHHPKLFVLQREDSIRIIITSANLVSNQWNNVTNTVWWQDFPFRSTPDLLSIFTQVPHGVINQDLRSDFAAQLAGFIASLVIDVPSQAHWITELTKYNFDGAMGYLITSVPGIHSYRIPYACDYALESSSGKFLGSVEASVVGLSHLFRAAADTNGAQLKRLAAFLGKSSENGYGMLEVVLRRNTNVPADTNAVSVLVFDPDQFSEGDCVQLGFLPRNVVKWLSPLWDSGFFRFSGYVYRREALAAALGGSETKVQIMLHVSQGPRFRDMLTAMQPEHTFAFCSLIASVKRPTGLWRLEEVLARYKWPELDQSDFFYGSSSIGSSINAQFLAAFASAAGKRSSELFDSEESDPEWGCWSASQELRNPSIRIIFPTIERVKNACSGVLPSKRILCFSEKTWQRMRSGGIFHDAVPNPNDRVGHPMHVKVACRRFQSRTDASSFGWVYCGSHNFSAAAWGRALSNGLKSNELGNTRSSLGLRLHVCNYELGIVFVYPPRETTDSAKADCASLDDVDFPFVVPAPKYGPTGRPATKRAMRDALLELTEQEREKHEESATAEDMAEEIPDEEEEEVVEVMDYALQEKEEDKAYADTLWIQIDSSQSC